ncbi:hypothetical protein ACIQNU_04540 [Streptomyces sp. NPDC091292]|uniref:hypothetical protein n=1 Tax=Streptomyces sp. NPDC091292 TaxID=3365991 RepID=UPI0037F68CAF
MIDQTIYGPYRFEPGIDQASPDGRTVTSRPINLGDWDKFALTSTLVPECSHREIWQSQYRDSPIRLSLECHAAGHKPWYVACEVEVTDPQLTP